LSNIKSLFFSLFIHLLWFFSARVLIHTEIGGLAGTQDAFFEYVAEFEGAKMFRKSKLGQKRQLSGTHP
jgi:hypothetical protein